MEPLSMALERVTLSNDVGIVDQVAGEISVVV